MSTRNQAVEKAEGGLPEETFRGIFYIGTTPQAEGGRCLNEATIKNADCPLVGASNFWGAPRQEQSGGTEGVEMARRSEYLLTLDDF